MDERVFFVHNYCISLNLKMGSLQKLGELVLQNHPQNRERSIDITKGNQIKLSR